MDNATARGLLAAFRAVALAVGIRDLDRPLDGPDAPTVPASMLVIAIAVVVMGWPVSNPAGAGGGNTAR